MFMLFSSNAERLFQRGILDVLALPEGHPIAFRYQSKYIAPTVNDSIRGEAVGDLFKQQGNRALIVYAQRPTAECHVYQYCPVRFAEITSLRLLGDIVFVEMTLREYANLSTWDDTSESRVAFLRTVRTRAGALVAETGQGYFLDFTDDCAWELWSDEHAEGQAWQTVVDKLAAMPSMANCLFYRIRGFFDTATRFPFQRAPLERAIAPKTVHGSLVYQVPVSAVVDLKLLFYRPSSADPKTIRADFEIEADKTGFSEIPDKRIVLESRYDELSIRLASKRVFDSVLAPVSIRLKGSTPENVLASEPLLLCVVRVPPSLFVTLVLSLFLVPLFFALSADDISWVLTHFPDVRRSLGIVDLGPASTRLAVYAKLLGSLIAAFAGFIIFRRLPVSK